VSLYGQQGDGKRVVHGVLRAARRRSPCD
jgi:hypothetical protein